MVKVALVTGGNKGIGFSIVKGLCQKFDGDVILAGKYEIINVLNNFIIFGENFKARDDARGQEAVKKLEELGLSPKFHKLDIDDKATIELIRDYLKNEYGGLDVLVNNAGIAFSGSSTVPVIEQAEKTIFTNYHSTKNVSEILFPILKKHARVVNITSAEGKLTQILNEEFKKELNDPNLTTEKLDEIMDRYLDDVRAGTQLEKGWATTTYRMSKLAANALSFILHRKASENPDMDIVVNAVHPGYVATDMSNHSFSTTPDEGAVAPIYLALLPPNVESPRGQFVWCDTKISKWDI